ncbi:hypothetical protein BgiBS90_028291 [Biomphalaria glabrata]|nr:hypothetical protein BgiBS90_028291 [Biomphalaria glabrata]
MFFTTRLKSGFVRHVYTKDDVSKWHRDNVAVDGEKPGVRSSVATISSTSPKPLLPPIGTATERIKRLLQPIIFSLNKVGASSVEAGDYSRVDEQRGSGKATGAALDGSGKQDDHSEILESTPNQPRRRRRVRRRGRQTVEYVFRGDNFNIIADVIIIITHTLLGSMYLNDCPAAPVLPVYLVTIGALTTVDLLSCILCRTLALQNWLDWTGVVDIASVFFSALSFLVFIAGCVSVFSLKSFSFEPSHRPRYCHPAIYYFTLSTISAFLLLVLFSCLALWVLYCLASYHVIGLHMNGTHQGVQGNPHRPLLVGTVVNV